MKQNNQKNAKFTIARVLLFFCGMLVYLGIVTADDSPSLAYMKQFSEYSTTISENTWDYVRSTAHEKRIRKIEKKRKNLVKSVKKMIKAVEKIGPFQGDDTYRQAILTYLQTYYTVLNEDYAKLVDMEEVSEQSYDLMEAYLLAKKKAGEKLEQTGDELNAQEKKFAEKYNITLIETESEISKKLKIADEVYDYYNKIYLIFFKSYKQEAYVLAAVSKNSVNEIEQNRKTLLSDSEEGLTKLSMLKDFNGDTSLKQTCKDLLEFYMQEAEKSTKMVDFYMVKDDFEKVNRIMKITPQDSRTQEQIDEYNSKVKVYNAKINEYNKLNNDLNSQRNSLIDAWNNAVSVFLKKHIPM